MKRLLWLQALLWKCPTALAPLRDHVYQLGLALIVTESVLLWGLRLWTLCAVSERLDRRLGARSGPWLRIGLAYPWFWKSLNRTSPLLPTNCLARSYTLSKVSDILQNRTRSFMSESLNRFFWVLSFHQVIAGMDVLCRNSSTCNLPWHIVGTFAPAIQFSRNRRGLSIIINRCLLYFFFVHYWLVGSLWCCTLVVEHVPHFWRFFNSD